MVAKKSSMPLLTVLMPVYNAEKFLAESINSILSLKTVKRSHCMIKSVFCWIAHLEPVVA